MLAFVAYPEHPPELADCIRLGVKRLNERQTSVKYSTWENNDIAGRPLTDPIFSKIEEAAFLVADVTTLNFNVTYEIGYAIGQDRRAYLVRNSTFRPDETARLIGIFDTLGYRNYQNADEFFALLSDGIDRTPLNTGHGLNQKAPVYVLETPQRSEAVVRMVSRVKKARLKIRSFSPSEDTRLAASDAISHVSTSYGVLIPLLSASSNNANIHNNQGSFRRWSCARHEETNFDSSTN